MVLCHGPQAPAAQQVRPRVSDVSDLGNRFIAGAAEPHGHDGRPHPGEPLVAPAGGEDTAVGLAYGGLEGGSGLELFEHVFVVRADLSRVGGAEGFQEQHSPRDYSSYLKVVEPTRTLSPCLKGVAPTVLRPLTNVPFVEPRSSTYRSPP